MKYHLRNSQNGAFFSMSVLIIVAVVIAISVIIMAVYMGVFSGTNQNNIPLVGIKQETAYVLVTSIHNGPVPQSDLYAQILNKETGEYDGNATINFGNDAELNIGDTILISNVSQGAYSVELIYQGNVIGHCNYNVYTML